MQFLSYSRRLIEQFPEAQFAAHAEAEANQVRTLYAEGFIRQIWRRADVPGACILMEADSLEHASERLHTLPLAKAGMLEITIIPLVPYPGFGPRSA